MADIKAGDPETLKSDSRAFQEWQEKKPAFADLVGARTARQAQILEFEKEQSSFGVVSLGEAIEWLAERDENLLVKRISKIWKALSADKSAFQIGGDLLPSVTIVQEDSSPPIEPFDASDVAAVCNSSMYKDPRALRLLIERLWAPRVVLQRLFQQNDLPFPPFWIDPPPKEPAAKKEKREIGKIPLLAEYLETHFPGGVPDPARVNRQMLIRDLIDAVPGLQKSLDPKTLKRAIDQHNEKVLQKHSPK
jgi:hypothetical protein